MQTATTDPLLTTADVAAFLSVPAGTLRQWRTRGVGPHGVRLGRGVRYRRADVDAWISEREAAEQSTRAQAG